MAKFLNIFPKDYWVTILILLQSLSVTLPILLFIKDNLSKFVYILFPSIWYFVLSDFHPDIFSIPIIFFIHNQLEKYQKLNLSILISLMLLLTIKLFYILLIFGYFLYFFSLKIDYKKKDLLIFFALIAVYLISAFVLYDRVENYGNLKALYQITPTNYLKVFFSYDNLITIFVLLLSTSFLSLFSFRIIIPCIPLLFFLFIIPTHQLHQFYNHYYIPIVIFFFIAFTHGYKIFKKKNSNKYLSFKILLVCLLCNVIFSPSPISIIFWSDYKWSFSKNTFIINDSVRNSHIKLNEIFENNKNNSINVLIENNVVFPKILLNFDVDVLGNVKKNNKKYDYVLLRSSPPYFIVDVICEVKFKQTCDNLSFKNKYLYEKNNNIKNLKIIFQNEIMQIYSKNND